MSKDEKKPLHWLGSEGEELRIAFTKVFGSRYEPFGSPSIKAGGLSDGKTGVQWNASFDPEAGVRRAGVNLEGMQYSDWPIATLIQGELKQPSLPGLIKKHDEMGDAVLLWRRDHWQKQSRPMIKEREIIPGGVILRDLTPELWNASLKEALGCLDAGRRRRGRAKQMVTLPSGEQIEGEVSPHLVFRMIAPVGTDWETSLRDVKARLTPLHKWTFDRSEKPINF